MKTLQPMTGDLWTAEDAVLLDLAYYAARSGKKPVTPLVEAVCVDGAVTQAGATTLASMAWMLHGLEWQKILATMSLEYNPIENYDRHEERTPAETRLTTTPAETTTTRTPEEQTVTRTPAETRTTTTPAETTTTRTPEEHTTTRTPAETTSTRTDAGYTDVKETDYDRHGFNSSTAVPVDKTTETITHTPATAETTATTTQQAETESVEVDNPETVAVTVDSAETTETTTIQAETESTETDNPETVALKVDKAETAETQTLNPEVAWIHGNIGVTTAQQMITAERELWYWNIFYEKIFPDLDKLLTLPIY